MHAAFDSWDGLGSSIPDTLANGPLPLKFEIHPKVIGAF